MDKLLKGLIFDNELSLTVIESTELVNKAIKIHKLSPLSAATLGRCLTMGAFMSSTLKNDKDQLSITVKGDGVGGKITVAGNGKLFIRGSIENPNAYLPLNEKGKLDVGGCVGKNGRITVVKNMGLKEPYSGSSKIVSGEIGEDFCEYYKSSEQTLTGIAVGVKIGKNKRCVGSGGVIIQALPNCSYDNLKKADKIIRELEKVSTIIEEEGIRGIVERYFKEVSFTEFYPKYKCVCSRRYVEKVLISLGKNELYDILKEQGLIKVNCEFCEKEHIFSKEDIEKLF